LLGPNSSVYEVKCQSVTSRALFTCSSRKAALHAAHDSIVSDLNDRNADAAAATAAEHAAEVSEQKASLDAAAAAAAAAADAEHQAGLCSFPRYLEWRSTVRKYGTSGK